MAVIVGFLVVHVALSLLVPRTLWAMLSGGPRLPKRERGAVRSAFRPDAVPDAALLDEHRGLIRGLQRRGLLRGAVSLGSLALLSGCKLEDSAAVKGALMRISEFNDRVQGWIFDPKQAGAGIPGFDGAEAAAVQRVL